MTTNSPTNRSFSNPVQANSAPQERTAGRGIAGGLIQGPHQFTPQASSTTANGPASAPLSTAQIQMPRVIMRPLTVASSGMATNMSPGVATAGSNAATVANSQPSTASTPRPVAAAIAPPAPSAGQHPAMCGMTSAGAVGGHIGNATSGGRVAASAARPHVAASHTPGAGPTLHGASADWLQHVPWESANSTSIPVSHAPASNTAFVGPPSTQTGRPGNYQAAPSGTAQTERTGTVHAAGPGPALPSSSANTWSGNRVAPEVMMQSPQFASQKAVECVRRARMAESRLLDAAQQLEETAQQLEEAAHARSEAATENAKLRAEITKVRVEAGAKIATVCKEAETEIAQARSKGEAQVTNVHASMNARLEAADEAVRAAEGRVADAEERASSAERRARDAERRAANAEGAADQVLDLMDEIEKYKVRARKLEEKLGERQQKLREREEWVNALEEQLKALMEQVKELEDQDAALPPRTRKRVRIL